VHKVNISLREKANSFDRTLRQRTTKYLRLSGEQVMRAMQNSLKNPTQLNRLDNLRSRLSQMTTKTEQTSFAHSPALRSGDRFSLETATKIPEEAERNLFIGELVLVKSRELFEKTQALSLSTLSGTGIDEPLEKTETTLAKIERLHASRSGPSTNDVTPLLDGEEADEAMQQATAEGILELEKTILQGGTGLNEKGIFEKIMALAQRRPANENEIMDTILSLSEKIRHNTGGLIRLTTLYLTLKTMRPGLTITIEDVEKTLEAMTKKGLIPGIRNVSSIKIVELVPVTYSQDQGTILELAAEAKGILNATEVTLKLGIPYERVERALKQFEELGMTKYETLKQQWTFPAFEKEADLKKGEQ
jgi:hypothetical protein